MTFDLDLTENAPYDFFTTGQNRKNRLIAFE